jgi:cation diffusion facilitator family transporter
MPQTKRINRLIQTLALASLAVSVGVLGLKYAAYRLTGSIVLYSDALESIVNVATAVAALFAVRLSVKPADANHPYGHHKAEYFSVVLEGVLIVIAALSIFREAYFAYMSPRAIDQPVRGMLLNGLATLINAAWSFTLIRFGRRRRSPALVADGRHLLTDVVSSIGAVIGVGLATLTGYTLLDPLLAAVLAVYILWSGWTMIRASVSGLMDEAVPPADLDKIRQIIHLNADGAIEAHDIRTRHAGRATFIDFHLVVPGSMAVSAAHEICDRVEQALKAEVPDSLITIHVEPEEKAKHHGVLVL